MNEVKVSRLGPFPRVSVPVFTVSAILIVGFIVFGAFFTDLAGEVFSAAQSFITSKFGWFFIVLMNAALVLCIFLAASRYGDIRLGYQTEAPQYSLPSWIGMLFSAGIGIGLLYWGTAEPLYHFMAPPMGEPETIEAAKQAMNISFLLGFTLGDLYHCGVGISLLPLPPWFAVIHPFHALSHIGQNLWHMGSCG